MRVVDTAAVVAVVLLEATTTAAAANFNRDGKPDIAVIDATCTGVAALRGKGDGNIAPQAYDGPIVADFNRDGRPDLAYRAQPSHTPGA